MKKLSKNKWKIPLYKVNNDVREIEAISKVIKRGMDWAIGSEIEQFEQNWCVAESFFATLRKIYTKRDQLNGRTQNFGK